jgi:hypothetical protein
METLLGELQRDEGPTKVTTGRPVNKYDRLPLAHVLAEDGDVATQHDRHGHRG